MAPLRFLGLVALACAALSACGGSSGLPAPSPMTSAPIKGGSSRPAPPCRGVDLAAVAGLPGAGAGQRSQDIAIVDLSLTCDVSGERPRHFVGITHGGSRFRLPIAVDPQPFLNDAPATVLHRDEAATFTLEFANAEMCDPVPPTRTYDAVEFTLAGHRMAVELGPEQSVNLATTGHCDSRLGVSALAVPRASR